MNKKRTINKKWEEEFIEYLYRDFIYQPNREELNKRLKDLLSDQKKDLREKIEKMKVTKFEDSRLTNTVIDDILKLIK